MEGRKEFIILKDKTKKEVLSTCLADKNIIQIIDGISVVVGLEKYANDEYKDEPDANGIYQPDDEKIKNKLDVVAQEEARKTKAKELNTLTITNNTVLYDAHQEAIGNMSAVIGIANATYIRLISVGTQENGNVPMSAVDAYNYVYKQTIGWKGADDKWHTVQLESLVETTQKAMTEKATVLSKY